MDTHDKKRSKLETWQLEDSQRLKALYEAWKEKTPAKERPSQQAIGERYNIGTQGNVWQLLNGRIALNEHHARAFSDLLGVPVSEFSPHLAEQIEKFKGTATTQTDIVKNVEPHQSRGKVPVISWVQAGFWMEAVDNFAPGQADEWIDTEVTVRRHTYALKVKGDSMEPDFPEGMILIVEPECDAENGNYVIAKNDDNEATFKQLVMDGGIFYLKPLNPRYPILRVESGTKIIGVVREAIMRRKL
jgi:SOS-response transcriptional repressor LexA